MRSIRNLLVTLGVGVIVLVLTMAFHPFGWFDGSVGVSRQDTVRPAGLGKVWSSPENLGCKSLVNASVPVRGEAKYTVNLVFWHPTTNTDVITMKAIGDVDACLRARRIKVVRSGENIIVTLDASGTVFHRPRVKPIPTAGSVHYHRGFTRGLMQALPMPLINLFITENSSRLTLEAQAYAQSLIGGSKCMQAVWPHAKQHIIDGYQRELTRLGFDTKHLQVRLVGLPNFTQNDMKKAPKAFGDTKFKVDSKHTKCQAVEQ